MAITTKEFIRELTADHDLIVIGGLAVIGHGFSRPTKDADVWLDPKLDSRSWAEVLQEACARYEGLTLHALPGWRFVADEDLVDAVAEIGMVRVHGLECPLDVFRKPTGFSAEDFAEVLSRSSRNEDGSWLPDPIDLAISKENTGRSQDEHDIRFLEDKVRRNWMRALPSANLDEAKSMFGRFVDWQVLRTALENPEPAVRELAMTHLREFADAGDPFSLAILEGREIP